MLGAGLVFILFLSLAIYPIWPYSRSWGYVPSAIAGALLAMLVGLLEVTVRL